MRIGETNEVGQAVFGYSNGHRLLTSTLQLSAVDVYELAAASDLAPGAKVSGDTSYLTGLALPDSKLYALIRTWLAPEMSRPGCVWSHVLLADHRLMATQIDLATLAELHRRPHDYASDPFFSTSAAINRRTRAGKALRRETEKVLLACYTDYALDETAENRAALEEAILAVWSQQWPRLRRQFTFRSVATTADLKGQSLRLNRNEGKSREAGTPAWLENAVVDATSRTVTPLRRFLWRYGKDVRSDRTVLPELVELYDATRSDALGYRLADAILTRFGKGQADTLKRDVLGLEPDILSQVPGVSATDLLRLLAKHQDLGVNYDRSQLAAVFSRTDTERLAELSGVLTDSRDGLGEMYDLVFQTLLPLLDAATLKNEDTPKEFILRAVTERPALLTAGIVDRLPNAALANLPVRALTPEQREDIVRVAMGRPFDGTFAELALSNAGRTLADGAAAFASFGLDEGWLRFFRENLPVFSSAVALSRDPMATARLLAFPMDPAEIVRSWFEALRNSRSTMTRDDQASVAAYLLALSIRHGIDKFPDVLAGILDGLRHRILLNDLPPDAADTLSHCLPSDHAAWDLNKRLLKLFRRGYKDGKRFDDILATMHLSDDEYAYATDQDLKEMVRHLVKTFTPWSRSE